MQPTLQLCCTTELMLAEATTVLAQAGTGIGDWAAYGFSSLVVGFLLLTGIPWLLKHNAALEEKTRNKCDEELKNIIAAHEELVAQMRIQHELERKLQRESINLLAATIRAALAEWNQRYVDLIRGAHA